MQKLFAPMLFFLVVVACKNDGAGPKSVQFQYQVSGTSQAEIKGTDCRFGSTANPTNAFIVMTSGVDVLSFRILIDELVPGTYMVNPGYVDGKFQASKQGDSFSELQLGSVFSGNQKFFNTASGDGGRVTISSIDGKLLKGNFQVSMLELVAGTAGTQPKINVSGDFTAVLQ
ncbi:hypothetical protein SAMN06298216_4106 [Spirosomataceae bacterium TFI 002]|nr:hypothetical protein SAMN06298216_4106 [Spirosomataceae bacterium TFI 002]